jgi:hypothetical protein
MIFPEVDDLGRVIATNSRLLSDAENVNSFWFRGTNKVQIILNFRFLANMCRFAN